MAEPWPPSQAPSQASGDESAHFRAVLSPHRSLGPKGFVVFMVALCTISFATGLLFFFIGAWPVLGFFGLDVLLVYIAFRLNFRALRVYETVDLSPQTLKVTRVDPKGREQSWDFNPYWVRLNLDERVGRTSELSLTSHGKRLVFGSFLTDPEREDFASALKAALREARGSIA